MVVDRSHPLSGSLSSGSSSGLVAVSSGLSGTLVFPTSKSLGGLHQSTSSLFGSLHGTWAESLHGTGVSKWILLLSIVHSGWGSSVSDDGLDLIGVDDSLDVSVGEAWSLEGEVGEFLGLDSWGTEKTVEGHESRSGPDTESTEMGTWGEVSDVKTVDVSNIDPWDV